ncbi:hypothetical protein M422DRAFT_34310 [Sphaerobolus stellatus SS14]|uniref:Unplaced genomic scaffold SPHSTscaffold_104, whole genome shotgun sequence n=1 Tax=Sphaerobolus stellatus (strain SS14) TaxID=990650 RepID=A0A0C9U0T4_SPHS4|nr:hypothetical protein M422DRAFT_34310 [Sphaerobolus stellatus SS14]
MSSCPIPRLRVLAGPSSSELTDVSELVNTARPHYIKSDKFQGRVVVHIKGFPGAPESEYFSRDDRKGVTWSIQMQGRFLQEYSADDILFGNTFDRPLRLPWGSGAALKFMHFIDPTLEHDLSGPRPWALSPLVTTMPHLTHTELCSKDSRLPHFPPTAPKSIKDDTKELCQRISEARRSACSGSMPKGKSMTARRGSNSSGSSTDESLDLEKASKRRTYFASRKNRRQVTFGPKDVLTTDFCYGFLTFPNLALSLPGGISFDLKKYWDGQPVRFVCVERQSEQGSDDTSSGSGEGSYESEEDERMFWCIVIVADDE